MQLILSMGHQHSFHSISIRFNPFQSDLIGAKIVRWIAFCRKKYGARAPKFLGALKVVPKLVASDQKIGRSLNFDLWWPLVISKGQLHLKSTLDIFYIDSFIFKSCLCKGQSSKTFWSLATNLGTTFKAPKNLGAIVEDSQWCSKGR